MSEPKHDRAPNRLIHESSPYLLQHAYNPVDWYPWGEEALNKSRNENKLIFLSIGYSSCHWCHVMAHESFEDPKVAEYLNEHFVPVKVDREERPDLDSIYMDAVQLMTGQGGWPLNIWLTPQLVPVYGGTYFPPKPAWQRPDFMTILQRLVHVFDNEPEQLSKHVTQMQEALQSDILEHLSASPLDPKGLDTSFEAIQNVYDATYGGFSRAPKFPHAMVIEFLFQYSSLTGTKMAANIALHSLQAMICGGIYDQIGGGFHRYSTDKYWLVPHFEKMLYDNALLLSSLTSAWQISKVPIFREAIEETIDFLTREMSHKDGGFYSALDADSEGLEGRYYVWTSEELKEILDEDELEELREWYPFDESGNWEGFVILNRGKIPQASFSEKSQPAVKDEQWQLLRDKLLKAREKRERPGTDDKILTAWNSLLIKSLVQAARACDRRDWLERAIQTTDFILDTMYKDGILYRVYREDNLQQTGFLDDYGCFIEALTWIFEATANEYYLEKAQKLADEMIRLFHDPQHDAFYYNYPDQDTPLKLVRDIFDNVTPSGSSSAISALLRLSDLCGEFKYHDIAVSALGKLNKTAIENAPSFGYLLQSIVHEHTNKREVIIVGPEKDRNRWIAEWLSTYTPHDIFVEGDEFLDSSLHLLENKKPIDGQTTAYICERFACEAPITNFNKYVREIQELYERVL